MKSRQSSALFAWLLVISLPLVLSSRALGDPIPAGWTSVDIGDVGVAGSASVDAGGALHVNGAGSDIWGSADSFHFLYQPAADGDISANPPSLENTNTFAKIGIMFRQSLDPGSPNVILDIRPDGSVEFMTRQTQDGPTTFIAGVGPSNHSWALDLIRSNGVVTARIQSSTGGDFQTLGSTPFPSGMGLAGAVVTSHDSTQLNHGVFRNGVFVNTAYPFASFDAGAVGLTGSAFVQDGVYTVRGAGADIWGTSDAYRAVVANTLWNGRVVARVTSEQAADSFAKAGVIITERLGLGDNPLVILDIRPNGIIEFMARERNAPMKFIAASAATLPVWLKIERSGQNFNQFAGYMSTDGVAWQLVGQTTVAMAGEAFSGLAVTAHDTNAINTSMFDHVEVSGQDPLYIDVGDVGIAGDPVFSRERNSGKLSAGGGDIWGTNDAFGYFYETLKDDGQMVVHISSLTDTHPFAKVGVMIRSSLDPAAANVLINANPNGHLEFLVRHANGAQTEWLGGGSPPTMTFPFWLKLTRTGSVVSGWTSSDFSTWVKIGETSDVQLSSDALIGIAVTSHARGVLTTATLDNIAR